LSVANKEIKASVEKVHSKMGLKLIEWNGIAVVTVNGRTALKTTYLRQLKDDAPIMMVSYRFQNNDRMHSLQFAYTKSQEKKWEPLMTQVLNSFTITNVR